MEAAGTLARQRLVTEQLPLWPRPSAAGDGADPHKLLDSDSAGRPPSATFFALAVPLDVLLKQQLLEELDVAGAGRGGWWPCCGKAMPRLPSRHHPDDRQFPAGSLSVNSIHAPGEGVRSCRVGRGVERDPPGRRRKREGLAPLDPPYANPLRDSITECMYEASRRVWTVACCRGPYPDPDVSGRPISQRGFHHAEACEPPPRSRAPLSPAWSAPQLKPG